MYKFWMIIKSILIFILIISINGCIGQNDDEKVQQVDPSKPYKGQSVMLIVPTLHAD